MSLQKADKITRQNQELPIEEEKYLQIMGSSKTTITKIESLDTLTVTSTDI